MGLHTLSCSERVISEVGKLGDARGICLSREQSARCLSARPLFNQARHFHLLKPTQLDPSIDIGIRLLANQDAQVQRAVEDVDSQPVAYIAKMYARRFAVTADEAAAPAGLDYAAFIGTQQVFRHDYTKVGLELSSLLKSALRAKLSD